MEKRKKRRKKKRKVNRFCNRSHVVFGGGELKSEHSSPIGNMGDRWLVITGKQRQPKSLLSQQVAMLAAADHKQKASNSRDYQTSFFYYKLIIGNSICVDSIEINLVVMIFTILGAQA